MQPFAEWAPDVAQWNVDVAGEASGVLVGPNSYRPLPQTAQTSPAAATVIRGAFAARTTGNAIAIFAASATKAYKFAGVTTSWTDVTRSSGGNYAVAADEYWQMRQFGDNLIIVNGSDAPQTIAVDAGTNFAALGGSPPNSRYIGVIGDFVFLGATATSRRAIKNSGRNDAAYWTAGQKDSDGQTFPDGGDVMGFVGLEVGGLVFQTETVRRIGLRTDSAIYDTRRIDAARGTSSPYSIVVDGGDAYYWSETGFMRIGSDGSIANIGINRVNEWFGGDGADWNKSRPKAIIGALDPIVRRIFWLYPRASNASSTTLDGLIVYDIERDRWTHATCALTYIFRAAVPGWTLAALAAVYTSLSAVPYPFGSDIWKGGAPGLAAFDASNKLCFFTGAPGAASVQTSKFEPIPGKRAFVQGFRLYGDATTATGAVGGSERPQSAIAWNASQPVNAQGRVPARISTRLCQVQVDIPAGEDWRDLVGIDFDPDDISPDGER